MKYNMENQVFEWDDTKEALNRRKHGGITFEDAMQVFNDPFALSLQDRIEGGEQRWQTLGETHVLKLLVVAHTVRFDENCTEVIRIISARRADRKERRKYDEHRQKNAT